jgi:hypothetical protein
MQRQTKPSYVSIKTNGQKMLDKKTTINTVKFRINQEIKFLYKCAYVGNE